MQWIQQIQARGMTDILTPLQAAITSLDSTPINTAQGMAIPFVFLMTDGCVENEREICQYLQGANSRTRVMNDSHARCSHFHAPPVCFVWWFTNEIYRGA
jgi:hypothetical protein